MRTTVTLDDDVAIELERRRRQRGVSFKQVLNDELRRAFMEEAQAEGPGVRTTRPLKTLDLGRPLIPNLDRVSEVLAHAEGEDYR
jgi:hypothetical protein